MALEYWTLVDGFHFGLDLILDVVLTSLEPFVATGIFETHFFNGCRTFAIGCKTQFCEWSVSV